MLNSIEQSQGQTKKCPKCQEDIRLDAKKCKHCGADLRNWFMKHKIITGILTLFVIGIIGSAMGSNKETSNNSIGTANSNTSSTKQIVPAQQEEVVVVFDVEALYGKNINEIRVVLGKPTDGDYTDPTAKQIQLGTKEWSNTFKKDKYELLVTYNVSNKEVIDFFVSTDDPSGATKDTKKLEKILNIQNSTNFTIEPIKTLKDPSVYTGIKVIPKK